MDIFFIDYLAHLERLHEGIKETLAELPQEALDWVPGPEMNSIGVLAAHVAGAERFWIGDVALQEPSERDRPAEFRTVAVEGAALARRLDDNLAYARTALSTLTLADLPKSRPSPRDQRTFTVAWSLLHALEHTAQHAAHMALTRQLWEQRAGG